MTGFAELPPTFEAHHVDDARADPILRNLYEFYSHEMAPWFGFETKADGSYSARVEYYWETRHRCHFLYASGRPIGFALVGSAEEWTGDPACRDFRDLFIVRRYRRQHLGLAFATWVWRQHPGPWLVRVLAENVAALSFWRATIASHTGGSYSADEHMVPDKRTASERAWTYFRFDHPDAR